MASRNGSGIIRKLTSIAGSNVKAYFILWKYAPELLPQKDIKTFQELSNAYTAFKSGTTEETCNAWLLLDDKVQRAVKWLKGRLNNQRMLELYDMFYEKAKQGDLKAFDAITKFSKTYFVEDKDDEDIRAFFQGVELPKDIEIPESELSDDEDFDNDIDNNI